MLYTGVGDVLFEGRLLITTPDMRAADGTTVVRWVHEVRINNGVVSLQLAPNEGGQPPGSRYAVHFVPSRGPAWNEQWFVPTSPTPLRIHQVRVAHPPPPSTDAFVDAETPAGAIDGSNPVFTLTWPPTPPSSVILTKNGLILKAGLDYAISGSVITFPQGAVPRPDDVLQAWYRSSTTGTFVDAETPAGTRDAVNRVFTLTWPPNPAKSLILVRNGLVLRAGLDYSISGSVITFTDSAIPQPGDVLSAWYRR